MSVAISRNAAVVSVLGSAALVYQLFESMISPALPLIQAGVHADQTSSAWIFTALLLSAAVSTPIVSRLADLHDKKTLFLVVMCFVLAGTATAALASSVVVLAVGQALQGVGLAMIPLMVGIIRDTQPVDVVARSNGVAIGMMSVGAVIGLLAAGVITSFFSYHFIFWIPFAIMAITTVTAAFVIPACPPRDHGRVDWIGAALLTVGLVAVLLSLNFAPSLGWLSLPILGGFALSLVLLVAFVLVQFRVKSPLVDLRIGGRPVVTMYVFTFVTGFSTFATFIAIPSIVASPAATGYGLGSTALVTGLLMLPIGVCGLIGAPLTAPLERLVGARAVVMIASQCIVAANLVLLAAAADPVALAISSSLNGLGLSVGLTQMSNTVVASVPPRRVVSISGMSWVIKSIGGLLGAQITASILAGFVIPDVGLPSWEGFTTVFIACTAVAMMGAVVTLALPRRTDIVQVPLAPDGREASIASGENR